MKEEQAVIGTTENDQEKRQDFDDEDLELLEIKADGNRKI